MAKVKYNYVKSLSNIQTNTITDIFANFNFDSVDSVDSFRHLISNLDVGKNFFDIYGFIGLDIDAISDIELIKSKYDELKNQLVKTETESEFTNTFSIFLNLIGFDEKKSSNIKKQLKIIDSICKIISNDKLKKIYDGYHLDSHINNIDANLNNTSKNKIDLINNVYANLFIEPSIKIDRNCIELLEEYIKFLRNQYSFNYIQTLTLEKLEKIYIYMNEKKYSNFDGSSHLHAKKYKNAIQIHLGQISNPQINCTEMDFLNKILIQNNIDLKYSNDLFNYWYSKKINDDPTGKRYNFEWQQNHKITDFSEFTNNIQPDNFEKEFVSNFNVDDFFRWCDKNSNPKHIESLDLEFEEYIKVRNNQTEKIQNDIEYKLDYYGAKKFTLNDIWNECDYSKTFNNYTNGTEID
jgi:hypothetical protein